MRRTSINVTDIDDPRNSLLQSNEPRRSFKVTETNDIVPKLKVTIDENSLKNKIEVSEDELEDKTSSSKELSSDYSDSSTPTFKSVMLIYDNKYNSLEEKTTNFRQSRRISKFLYDKVNFKLMDLSSSLSFRNEDERGESFMTVKDDEVVINQVLDLLQRFNYKPTYDNDNIKDVYLPIFSYDYSFKNSSSEHQSDSEKYRSISKISEEFIVPSDIWIEDNVTGSPTSLKLSWSTLGKLNKTYSLESKGSPLERIYSKKDEIKSLENKTSYLNSSGSKEVANIIRNRTKENTEEDNYQTGKMRISTKKNSQTERTIGTSIKCLEENLESTKKSKQLCIQNMIETNFNRNKNSKTPYINTVRTFDKNLVNFSMTPNGKCTKELPVLLKEVTDWEIKQFKVVYANKSFIIPNFEKKIFFTKKSDKIAPHTQVLSLDDIVLLNRGTIFDLNDFADAISRTMMLRYFGLTKLSDTRLAKKAVVMIEQKSEKLKCFFNKKFPMLQKSIGCMINHINYREFDAKRNVLKLPVSSHCNPSKSEGDPYSLDFHSILNRMELLLSNHVKPVVPRLYNSKSVSNYAIHRNQAYQRNDMNPYQNRLRDNLESLK